MTRIQELEAEEKKREETLKRTARKVVQKEAEDEDCFFFEDDDPRKKLWLQTMKRMEAYGVWATQVLDKFTVKPVKRARVWPLRDDLQSKKVNKGQFESFEPRALKEVEFNTDPPILSQCFDVDN